jgi:hypothetical protein
MFQSRGYNINLLMDFEDASCVEQKVKSTVLMCWEEINLKANVDEVIPKTHIKKRNQQSHP